MFAFLLTVCCIWLFDPPVLVAEGTASYYTRDSGTLTASGEAFDEKEEQKKAFREPRKCLSKSDE